jgi:hypothetical protein
MSDDEHHDDDEDDDEDDHEDEPMEATPGDFLDEHNEPSRDEKQRVSTRKIKRNAELKHRENNKQREIPSAVELP